jgi:hypothetical protein
LEINKFRNLFLDLQTADLKRLKKNTSFEKKKLMSSLSGRKKAEKK